MHLQSEWLTEQRVFVAEYDFSKFFDRISHDHIWRTIRALGFIMTPLEERLLRAFLASPDPYTNAVEKAQLAAPRSVGVPQGTSISLLLANLAATPLDRSLERLGVGFVRYADDTLIWSRDYAAVCQAVDTLHAAAEEIGSPINYEKSEGVRLLVSEETNKAEMRFTSRIEYLGHSIGLRDVRMKQAVVDKIKSHISNLILNNLLREPLAGTQSLSRLTGNDRDYTTLIWQLRRYLYGPLSESQVRRFHRGAIPPMTFEGVMSFFPLVNDQAALQELDAWIATQVWLAIRKRARLLSGSVSAFPEPWLRDREELFRLIVRSTRTSKPIDLRLPSVARVSSVIRAAVLTHGTKVVGSGSSLYLYET
jgi:RNA-directed DNA polymerase